MYIIEDNLICRIFEILCVNVGNSPVGSYLRYCYKHLVSL